MIRRGASLHKMQSLSEDPLSFSVLCVCLSVCATINLSRLYYFFPQNKKKNISFDFQPTPTDSNTHLSRALSAVCCFRMSSKAGVNSGGGGVTAIPTVAGGGGVGGGGAFGHYPNTAGSSTIGVELQRRLLVMHRKLQSTPPPVPPPMINVNDQLDDLLLVRLARRLSLYTDSASGSFQAVTHTHTPQSANAAAANAAAVSAMNLVSATSPLALHSHSSQSPPGSNNPHHHSNNSSNNSSTGTGSSGNNSNGSPSLTPRLHPLLVMDPHLMKNTEVKHSQHPSSAAFALNNNGIGLYSPSVGASFTVPASSMLATSVADSDALSDETIINIGPPPEVVLCHFVNAAATHSKITSSGGGGKSGGGGGGSGSGDPTRDCLVLTNRRFVAIENDILTVEIPLVAAYQLTVTPVTSSSQQQRNMTVSPTPAAASSAAIMNFTLPSTDSLSSNTNNADSANSLPPLYAGATSPHASSSNYTIRCCSLTAAVFFSEAIHHFSLRATLESSLRQFELEMDRVDTHREQLAAWTELTKNSLSSLLFDPLRQPLYTVCVCVFCLGFSDSVLTLMIVFSILTWHDC